jgi:prepilin-type processing-associated H-X9-DG protein
LDKIGSPHTSWAFETPPVPVHGGKRDYLFFDCHVSTQAGTVAGKY